MPDFINILTELIFILLHFFVLVFSYFLLGKKKFHPGVLFAFVWMMILIFHLLFKFTLLIRLYSLSIETYIVFFTGSVFFTLGCFLVQLYWSKKDIPATMVRIPHIEINLLTRVIFSAVVIVCLPLYIRASFEIFLASRADDFFSGLRHELSYSDVDIGPLKYMMSVAFVIFAFNLYAFYKKKDAVNKILLLLVFMSLIIYAVFATGRTYYLMILAVYLGITIFVNPQFSIRKYLVLMGVFMILFMLVGIVYNKGGNADDTFQENLKSSSEGIGIYMVGSLNALDNELTQQRIEPQNGDNTLRFFIKLGISLHLIPEKKVNSFVQEFVFVPYPTNVFTCYSPYIRDFGKLYAWIMFGIFGALQTWLFNKAAYSGSIRWMLYYAFLLSPLLLSFFGDQYLSSFSFWLQIAVITEVFLLVNKIIILQK